MWTQTQPSRLEPIPRHREITSQAWEKGTSTPGPLHSTKETKNPIEYQSIVISKPHPYGTRIHTQNITY